MTNPATTPGLAGQVAETLRAAGHDEAVRDRAGFFAVANGSGGVIVVADPGAHAEGHFDSPGRHAAEASAVSAYAQALAAAGWAVRVHPSGEGLVVTGRAK